MRKFMLTSLTCLLLAACGSPIEPAAGPTTGPDPSPHTEGEYKGTGLVLETEDAQVQLCLGGVLESLPPQCGGFSFPLDDWNWDAVQDEDRAAGTTWGTYEVVGLFDGKRFIVLGAGAPPPHEDEDDDYFKSPCPEPEGGWTQPDPDMTAESDRIRAMHEAEEAPDFAGSWIDYIDEPSEYTDPSDTILILAFTGDLERREQEAREHWGGALCVTQFERTFRELRRAQKELHDGSGMQVTGSDVSVVENVVELYVVVLDASQKEAIDARYGEGTVRIEASLQPVP
jgi:hypothetical protein